MATKVPTLKEGVEALKALLNEEIKCTGVDHHVMQPGQKFCPDCASAVSLSALTPEVRVEKLIIAVAAMYGAMGELAEAGATLDPKDDLQIGKKIKDALSWLVTPIPQPKKSK